MGNNVIGGRERAKHIDIPAGSTSRTKSSSTEKMRLIKVPTSAQLADMLTKGPHLPQRTMCVWRGS